MTENVVIIGSGPGAFMAGIYAATANLNPIIIQEKTKSTEEFEGVNKIAGLTCDTNQRYLELLYEQAKRFNVRFLCNTVQEVYFGKQIKIIFETGELNAKTCIIDDHEIAKRVLHVDLFKKEDVVFCEEKSTLTILPGLFACGNAREMHKEAILMTASGCMAALDAKDYIEANHIVNKD